MNTDNTDANDSCATSVDATPSGIPIDEAATSGASTTQPGRPKKTSAHVTPFRKWHDGATMIARQRVAALAGTSVKYLDHIAKGRKQASAELAARLEEALVGIGVVKINRGHLCEACSTCPYRTQQPIEELL